MKRNCIKAFVVQAAFLVCPVFAQSERALDIGRLTALRDKQEAACQLRGEGKTVKSDKDLKVVQAEVREFLKPYAVFSVGPQCPLVWDKARTAYRATFQCNENLSITWAFGENTIGKGVLEQMQELSMDQNGHARFFGTFRLLLFAKENFSLGFGNQCGTFGRAQAIELYAVPIVIRAPVETPATESIAEPELTLSEAMAKLEQNKPVSKEDLLRLLRSCGQ